MTEYLEAWKRKKWRMYNEMSYWRYFNHPHQLETVSLSGSVSFVIDERLGVGADGTSFTTYEADADYSLAPSWSRVLMDKVPIADDPLTLGAGELTMMHRACEPWKATGWIGATPEFVAIGTYTTKFWVRDTTGDPWTLDSSVTVDILFSWVPFIGGGGLAPSYGKGTGGVDEDCGMYIAMEISIEDTAGYPDFSSTEITRSPYTDPWSSETAEFASIFSDWLSATAGASGSCSLSLDFT